MLCNINNVIIIFFSVFFQAFYRNFLDIACKVKCQHKCTYDLYGTRSKIEICNVNNISSFLLNQSKRFHKYLHLSALSCLHTSKNIHSLFDDEARVFSSKIHYFVS